MACIDHHVSAGALPPGPRYVDPDGRGDRRAGLRDRPGERLAGHPGRRPGALRRHPDRHRRLPLQQYPAAHAARRRRSAGDRARSRGDLSRRLRQRARGPARLLAEALQTLVVEPEYGLAWVTVPPGAIERLGVSSDDLDGVVEFPRSIEGVRMALLFREASPRAGSRCRSARWARSTSPRLPSRSAAAGTSRPPGCRCRVAGRGAGAGADAAREYLAGRRVTRPQDGADPRCSSYSD